MFGFTSGPTLIKTTIQPWLNSWPQDKEGRKKLRNKKNEGYIDGLAFTVDGKTVTTAPDSANDADVVKLVLPAPLLPGQSITIATPFHVKLPFTSPVPVMMAINT